MTALNVGHERVFFWVWPGNSKRKSQQTQKRPIRDEGEGERKGEGLALGQSF